MFYITEFALKNAFNICFVGEEGEHCEIYHFDYDDLVGLIKMEKIIGEKMLALKVRAKAIIEDIDYAARICLEDATKIKAMSENTHCTDVQREMAINHSSYFYDFVSEIKKNDNPEE